MVFEMPDAAIPPEHPARVLWSVLSRMDLSAFLADALAFEGGSGRSTMSPRMRLTLWTYAISRGVGSADVAYQWTVGGCRPGRATIASFRVNHLSALDGLLTDVLAALMEQGVLSPLWVSRSASLETVALDGRRVRAAASARAGRAPSEGSARAGRRALDLDEAAGGARGQGARLRGAR